MNKKDAFWQGLIDEEKERVSRLPVEELLELEALTLGEAQREGEVFAYQLCHHVKSESVPYASRAEAQSLAMQLERQMKMGRPQREWHSFVLVVDRPLWLGFTRRYLAGFGLDQDGHVVPIDEDVLYSFD